MATQPQDLERFVGREYRHGFVTTLETDSLEPGLSEDVIRLISAKKNEPEFMLEWRLKAYRHWRTMDIPTWSDTLGESLDWYIRGEVAYRDDVYFFPDLDPEAVGDAYTLFNASLGLSAADLSWQVILWGKNLADEDYLVSASSNFDSGDPRFGGTPVEGYRVVAGNERTYGVTLKYSF